MFNSLSCFSRVMACLVFAGLAALHAQTTPATNTPATNGASATPPAAGISLGDIVSRAQADTTTLQEDQAGLKPDPTLPAIEEKLPAFTHQIDLRNTEDAQLLAAHPALSRLQASQSAWQSISDNLASAQKDLSLRVQQLDTLLGQLNQLDDTWKATLDGARKTTARPELVQRIQQVRALIADTSKAVQTQLAPLYTAQIRVAAQATRTKSGLDAVGKAIDTARSDLFKQDHPPLWEPAALASQGTGVFAQERASFSTQIAALQAYFQDQIGAVLVHLLLFALLVIAFYWIRNGIHARATKEPALREAALVFDVPLATALLVALLATWVLYSDPPRLFLAGAEAIALIPAVIVTRRLIDPVNFSILYAALIAYLVDQVRHVVTPSGVLSRFLLLAELLAISIFLLIALRSRHLTPSSVESNRLRRFARIYLHFLFLVFVFAGFANVFGYLQLSMVAGESMLDSSYLAVILYAAVRILDALVISGLSIRPFSGFGMVRTNRDLLYRNITAAIRWLAFAIWLLVALQWLTLRDPLWQEIRLVLDYQIDWFFINFKLGAIIAFPITVWATFLISRFIRFVLKEEVYPHLQLGRGVPYAASTMVHYVILLLGFFAAVAATGAPLSQFSFLAGAFGVGLGFGLQNIFNNFVSGVILLFERPVKVGDIIQMDPATIGTVERIGIRASVIRLTNGSELIVPNGNLISNPVTNWTLSNCERLIEIPVNITSKVDPQHVLQLLTAVVHNNPGVLKNPAPQTLLVTFGAALNFRVRAWIGSEQDWMTITSDLSLAISAALAHENIALA